MPRIHYVNGPAVESEERETVVDAAERYGIDLRNSCGADCRCSTCRVEVLEGAVHCSEPPGKRARGAGGDPVGAVLYSVSLRKA